LRLLKALSYLVLLLATLYFAGGFLLADRAEIERSVVIERPPGEIYDLLDDFGRFNAWSPWRDYDASASYGFAGPAEGVGAIMRWHGKRGAGSQEIIAVDRPHSIAVKLDFGAEGTAVVHFLLRPAGAGTRVSWRLQSDAKGSFSGRWFNLLLERMLGPDFERGLADLKTLAESLSPAGPAAPLDTAPQEPGSGAVEPAAVEPSGAASDP
jgi:uncharacterized protein YndB with AHSA1/START domain